MTSSPGPMPSPRRISEIASVPLATPMHSDVPQYFAYSASNAATYAPPMKPFVEVTFAHASSSWSAISACWPARSRNGMPSAASCCDFAALCAMRCAGRTVEPPHRIPPFRGLGQSRQFDSPHVALSSESTSATRGQASRPADQVRRTRHPASILLCVRLAYTAARRLKFVARHRRYVILAGKCRRITLAGYVAIARTRHPSIGRSPRCPRAPGRDCRDGARGGTFGRRISATGLPTRAEDVELVRFSGARVPSVEQVGEG